MNQTLLSLLTDWETWAIMADRSEDGWPSDYPRWNELMQAARDAMGRASADMRSIEKCWVLSEEDEWLADHVKGAATHHLDLLTKLTRSSYPRARWQAYSCLEYAGVAGIPMLGKGMTDPDAYVRRRAVLALAKIAPELVLAKSESLSRDSDPANREIFAQLKFDLLNAAGNRGRARGE